MHLVTQLNLNLCNMPSIVTCGRENKRTQFAYTGNSQNGVKIEFTTNNTKTQPVKISAEVIEAILKHFRGRTVAGGFSMTDPPVDGVGYFFTTTRSRARQIYVPKICVPPLRNSAT